MRKDCSTQKDFSKELELIDNLRSLNNTTVSVFYGDVFLSDGMIVRKGNKNKIEFPLRTDDYKDVTLRTKQGAILYTTLHEEGRSNKIKDKNIQHVDNYSFSHLKSHRSFETFNSKFRCLIPVEKSVLNTFRYQLETTLYSDNITTYFYDCISPNVNNTRFDIIQLKKENTGFYVIDSIQKMSFEDFADYCYSIQQAIGFIMGYMPGGNLFYFSEDMNFWDC